MRLRTKLDTPWKGECALAKIIMPLHFLSENQHSVETPTGTRKRRDLSPGGSLDPHVYLDTIGVPRGVPDEFKARDEVAAGFESIFTIVTVNKNVAWINYIYYNQQRFVNYTRDALQGVAEQLEAASQMAFQNRIALDMILAEKGGACVYINNVQGCCTYIPNSTGPNGKVTLAIQKLQDLSLELKSNSGVDNPWRQYFGWFANWKQTLINICMLFLGVLLLILILVYCVIPCSRKLLFKCFSNTFPSIPQPQKPSPQDYALYLTKYRKAQTGMENHTM